MNRHISFVIIAFIFKTVNSFADTSDEFNRYVDRMIPLSFEIAKTSAGLREHELFLNLLSQSQSELGLLSESVLKLSKSMNRVSDLSDQACVLVDESVLSGLYDLNHIIENLKLVRERMNVYRFIRSGLDSACEGDFSHLKIGENESRILVPQLDGMDGVYVSAGTDSFKAIYDLFASIFSFLTNESEEKKIQEAAIRYEAHRAHDDYLQLETKNACLVERDLFRPSFNELDRFFNEIESQFSLLDSIKIDRVQGKLLDCIRTIEKETIDSWLSQVAGKILSDSQKDSSTQESVSRLKIRGKITSSLVETESKSCNDISIESHEAILGAAVVLGIDQEYSSKKLISNINRCKRGSK